jgi:hypothetical protein
MGDQKQTQRREAMSESFKVAKKKICDDCDYRHSGCSCGESFWNAVLTELERAIPKILEGIDKVECEDPEGWWETSTGAEFGKERLDAIFSLIRSKKGGA